MTTAETASKDSSAINWWLAAFLLLVLIGAVAFAKANEQQVESEAKAHLTTMLMLRESVLRSYFDSLRSEVTLWSGDAVVVEILLLLNRLRESAPDQALTDIGERKTGDLESASDNSRDNVAFDVRVREFADHHEYYDVFFINPEGDVVYTVTKEADLGTNLIDGPYADSGLGRVFRTLASASEDTIVMEDFSSYAPSADQPAAFLGSRVLSPDGEFIGVYAIQVPEQPINHIMQFSAGMGESGEIYLVGEDRLMRSTSRFFDESTVLKKEVDGATVRLALDGQQGVEIVEDYRGVPVYSAYRNFDFEGLRWAVLAEQDLAEVRQPIQQTRWWLGGAFTLLCLITLMLRFMLVRIVLPASLAALLGLSFVQLDDPD